MKRGVGWSGALALALAVSGCSKDENPPPPPPQGDGTVKSIATAVNGGTTFRLPFDAALSPDGKTAYFTALVDEGAALFKVPTAGGMVTRLADLVSPGSLDVTSDGQTVVVADPGVESGTGALGAMLTVSASGGSPSVLTGTVGTLPRGVAIAGGRIVFTGTDPADGAPGVFETTASGGLTIVLKSGILEPSGVAIGSAGEVYVLDAEGDGARTQHILKIVSGTATELVKGLRVGFPAGLAVAQNGANLLVASTDPATGKARLERFAVSGMPAGNPFTGTVGSFDDPAGLHRAAPSDSYAYVDSEASGAGTVFVVNPQ
jgi:DNA-binding beta-propeller fold protein YncE